MTSLILALALAVDLPPRDLIDRLASPDRVAREEAARTLEERGQDALPALREALAAAPGTESRQRLRDLIARVEARSLDRPTLVALDFDNQPLGEAIVALAARSGHPITLDDPALAGRRITAKAPSSVPFWDALDRVSAAGGVRHDPRPHINRPGSDSLAPAIRLTDGGPPAPAVYSGPLRVHLLATHRHRDLNFDDSPGREAPRQPLSMTVEIQAFAEPGRLIQPNGQPRIVAVDERGQAIAPQPGGEPSDPAEHAWLTPGRLSLLHWHVPLGLPDPPGPSPLRLRGVLPVIIATKGPEPMILPLTKVGASCRQGRWAAQFDKVAPRGRSTSIELVLSEESDPARSGRAGSGAEDDHLGDYLRDRLEFQDEAGRPVAWSTFGPSNARTQQGRIRVTALVEGDKPPARLLVHRLNRLAAEIPIEFADVPSF